jgi:hypothetical protein
VKRLLVPTCVGALLLTLGGCGSSSPPPLTLACKGQRLPGNFIQLRVSVTNTTDRPQSAVVYGPALQWLRHISPVLSPAQVVVKTPHARQAFIGYLVPHVSPKQPSHVMLRFATPNRPRALVVTNKRTVQASSLQYIQTSTCKIR